jgi:hypothetical protein
MDDAPAPPEPPAAGAGELPAPGDVVLIRGRVRLVSERNREVYVEIDGRSPHRQLWVEDAAIEGRAIHSPRPAFRTGDRVRLTGTVVAAGARVVTLLPDHRPLPTPAARLRIEPGYLELIEG